MKELPTNMTFVWGVGSKSFAEVYSNPLHSGNQRVEEWKEGIRGTQLDESFMLLLFHQALALAQQSPDRHIGYIRYDIEGSTETQNNRPFKPGEVNKVINYDGYQYNGR